MDDAVEASREGVTGLAERVALWLRRTSSSSPWSRRSSLRRWISSSSAALFTSSSSSSAIRSIARPSRASRSCSDESFSLPSGSAPCVHSGPFRTVRSSRGRRCRAPCRAIWFVAPSRTRGSSRAREPSGPAWSCAPSAWHCSGSGSSAAIAGRRPLTCRSSRSARERSHPACTSRSLFSSAAKSRSSSSCSSREVSSNICWSAWLSASCCRRVAQRAT